MRFPYYGPAVLQECSCCEAGDYGQRDCSNCAIGQRLPGCGCQSGEQKHGDQQFKSEQNTSTSNLNLNNGAQGRIRTSVARKERQIYSLLPLTTRPPVRNSPYFALFSQEPAHCTANGSPSRYPHKKSQVRTFAKNLRGDTTLSSSTGELELAKGFEPPTL